MGLFQLMLNNTIEKQFGTDTDSFINEVCLELGVPFEELKPEHMKHFSEIAFKKAEPRIGNLNAKTMAGIISHFDKSRVG